MSHRSTTRSTWLLNLFTAGGAVKRQLVSPGGTLRPKAPVVPRKVGAGAVALRHPLREGALGAELLVGARALVARLAAAPVDDASLLGRVDVGEVLARGVDARVVGREQEGLERGGGGAGQLADGSLPARELLRRVSRTCRGRVTDI